MSETSSSLAERLFDTAVQIREVDEQAAFLDQVCQGNPALRDQLDALLAAHAAEAGFLPGLHDGGEEILETVARPTRPGSPSALIGCYKLLEKIGEGGFGEVWMAEQREPVKRRLALKIVKPGMDSRQVVARFEAERQALALMDHANIARIFDAGTTDTGRPYFVMELVRGEAITDYCDRHRLRTDERLRLFMLVCHAVQHAHQKGIIHRDLKPSNVLVTVQDGVAVPKVIDFGIAKALHQELTDKTLFTQFAQFIGTPAYISPEQSESNGADIDTRSDVYSLGILLYELLVGQTPFDAKEMVRGGVEALRRIIREKEPTTPSNLLNTLPAADRTTTADQRRTDALKLVNQLRGDLDWIVMKCLEKDRARRYETANGLAMDIQRHLANEPIVARPPGAWYRIQKFVRRNRLAVAATTLILLALTVGVSGVIVVQNQANQDYRRRLYVSEIGQASAAWRAGQPGQLGNLLENCPPDLRNWEWDFLRQQADRWSHEVVANIPNLADAAFTVDGQLMAASTGNEIQIIELPAGRRLRAVPFQGGVFAVSPSDDQLATATQAGMITVWNMRTGERVVEMNHGEHCQALVWSADGQRMASGGSTGMIQIWDPVTGQSVKAVTGPSSVVGLALSPGGRTLAVEDLADHVQLIDVASESVNRTLPARGGGYRVLKFSPDGRYLAVSKGGDTRDSRVWNLEDGGSYDLRCDTNTFSFSADGRLLWTVDGWGKLRHWDLDRRVEMEQVSSHVSWGIALQCLSDGRILSASHDGLVKLWQDRGSGMVELLEYPGSIRTVAFSPDSRWLVAAGVDSSVYIWDVRASRLSGVYSGHRVDVFAVAFSPNGQVATTDTSCGVQVWDPITRNTVWSESFSSATNAYWLAYSPDGRRIYVVSRTKTIAVLDAATGKQLARVDDIEEEVMDGLAVSPDGQLLAVGHKVKLSVWKADGLRPLWQVDGNPDRCVAFSPDGAWIATGDQDGALSLWNVASEGRVCRRLLGHSGSVKGVSFHPDGSRLVSCGADGLVKLWDWQAGVELLSLPIPSDVGAWHVAFSPDGKTIAVGDDEGVITLRKIE